MVFLFILKESFSALWANKLRSFLTLLGMVMGVTSVIAIVSTVEGMQGSIEDTLSTMGPHTFMVTRFGVGLTMEQYLERLKRKKLTRKLIPAIEEGCDDCQYVGAEGYASAHLKYGKAKMRWVAIYGQTANVLEIQDMDVADGRFISEEDDRRRRQVAYIGDIVRESLFGDADPIGERIRVGEREFTVIGVGEKVGGMFGNDMDQYVIIPLSTMQILFPKPGNPINLLIASTTLALQPQAMDQVRVVLRSIRKLTYEEEDDFGMVTPDAILSFINDFTAAFRAIMIALPALSVIIGGIVIMNIMMISVTERTREIGIRKALGARRKHILVQFLYESLALSLLGGALGIALGAWAGSTILSSLMDIEIAPTTMAIVLGVSISLGVGLFFGIYPAMKAARLDPIKALGYE